MKDVSRRMEDVAGEPYLTWKAAGKARASMEELSGVWRLVYSSAFLTGNLGGSRPGPPSGLLPIALVWHAFVQ